MAIKEYIYLLGVEDIEKALDRLKSKGEESLSSFRDLGGAGLGEPFTPISQGAKNAADATEGLTIKAHDLHSVFYILRPVLQAAGFEVGQFAAMGRLASVGIGGIAAAAAGAVLVGLARLEDSARTTRGQLEDLFQSKALSEKAFAGIQASAQQFNTTISSIVPGVEALKTAWDRFVNETRTFKFVGVTGGDIGQIIPPGMVGSVESLQTAYDNFIKLLRAGRLDQTNATKTAEAFFKAMQNGGKLTADILRTLPTGTINELAQAMGRGSIGTEQFINEVKLAPINLDKLIEALGRFSLESDTAFRDKAILTYRDSLGEILNTLSSGFKGLAGISFSDALVAQLQKFNQIIKDDIRDLNGLIELIKWIENHTPGSDWLGFLTQKARQGAAAIGMPGTGITPEVTGAQNTQVWEAAGISAADRFAKGFRDAPTAAADMATTAQSDAQEFGKAYTDTLNKIVTDANPILQQLSNNPIDTSGWQSAIDDIKNRFQSLYDQVVQMFSNPIQIQFQTNSFLSQQPTNLASGGYIRGPGTTTSDSIWAFLSNREYVTRAKAVEYYGLPFMNAINAMRLPKNLFAGHFAGGGLARAGAASSGRPVTLVIDTHSFDMNASADTVKALSKFSVARQLSATGRKPSWVK